MLELLEEQLRDYNKKYALLHVICIHLMENKGDWKKEAEKVAGLKIMIEAIESKIKMLKS